jgi:hypothetical protein
MGVGDRSEHAVHAGAARAHLRAELQQGGALAEGVGSEPTRLHDFIGRGAAGTILRPPQESPTARVTASSAVSTSTASTMFTVCHDTASRGAPAPMTGRS